jgi:acyl-CoA thioesterase-1
MKIAFSFQPKTLSKATYGARTLRRNITLATVAVTLAAAIPVAATAEPVTIVALGDSLTAGYGLPEGDGFVPQLQDWLTAQGADATVINAGVSGDTTAGGLSRLDWSLTPETDALIVTLGGNDLLRGLPPSETRKNMEAIVKQATERGLDVLIIPMQAPGNYGPEYKTAFDTLYPDIAQTYGARLATPFFAPLAPDATDLADLTPWMQPDGIHPSRDGVARIVAGLGPTILELAQSAAD